MTEFLTQLNNYSGALLALSTALMVILTGAYVYFTWRISKANALMLASVADQIWSTTRARLVCRLVHRGRVVQLLEVSNQGGSPAENVSLRLDQELYKLGDQSRRINDLPLFSSPIPCIPVGIKYEFFLLNYADEQQREQFPKSFQIFAAYQTLGRRVEESTTFNTDLFKGVAAPLQSVEESLEKLTDSVTKGFRDLLNATQADDDDAG